MPMIALATIATHIAAMPFLPRGKGALILILGGLLMLSIALAWSMLSVRQQRPRHGAASKNRRASRAAAGPGAGRTVHTSTLRASDQADASAGPTMPASRVPLGSVGNIDMAAPVLERASQMGIPATLTSASSGTCTLRLDHCASCTSGKTSKGCRREARLLHHAAGQSFDDPHVQELRCRQRGDPACVFQIAWGHAPTNRPAPAPNSHGQRRGWVPVTVGGVR